MDCSQGSIRILMRMALLFEWALRGSFGTLPIQQVKPTPGTQRYVFLFRSFPGPLQHRRQ